MASVSRLLPRIFQWAFLVLAILCGIAACFVVVALLVSPKLPAGLSLGPAQIDLAGQPGTVLLRAAGNDSDFQASLFGGNISLTVEKAGGLIALLEHSGLPLILLNLVFLAVLFELLRRLFRNVGQGQSFTPGTIRLVQGVGGLLILFSFILSFAEGVFAYNLFTYLVHHAVIVVSGATIHLPALRHEMFPRVDGFPFDSSLFFTGLLVLALSEVFRQGLALRDEHALTI